MSVNVPTLNSNLFPTVLLYWGLGFSNEYHMTLKTLISLGLSSPIRQISFLPSNKESHDFVMSFFGTRRLGPLVYRLMDLRTSPYFESGPIICIH